MTATRRAPVHDVVVEGFTFGAITDFESQPSDEGDAFVIAPDNSRAGLVWTVSMKPLFSQICAPERDRWGVWDVAFPNEMTSRENIKAKLGGHPSPPEARMGKMATRTSAAIKLPPE